MGENVKNMQNHVVGRHFHNETKPQETFHCVKAKTFFISLKVGTFEQVSIAIKFGLCRFFSKSPLNICFRLPEFNIWVTASDCSKDFDQRSGKVETQKQSGHVQN